MGRRMPVAIRADAVKLIQVKSNRNPGSAEMEALELFAAPAWVSKEVWRWDDFAREPRVSLVDVNLSRRAVGGP